ncbi:MAG: glycine cleavage system protein GcvH [Gemmatimonadota bacterium]
MSGEAETRIPEELRYSEQHEWLAVEADVGTVGITDYAQSELGDIVFVELPAAGTRLERGQSFGTVEAVKTVEELYAPVSGEVLEVNTSLEEEAEQVNQDPYGSGWMLRLRLDQPAQVDQLLDASGYAALIAGA